MSWLGFGGGVSLLGFFWCCGLAPCLPWCVVFFPFGILASFDRRCEGCLLCGVVLASLWCLMRWILLLNLCNSFSKIDKFFFCRSKKMSKYLHLCSLEDLDRSQEISTLCFNLRNNHVLRPGQATWALRVDDRSSGCKDRSISERRKLIKLYGSSN